MMVEEEFRLFRQFLNARGKVVAPESVNAFVDALNSPPRERLGKLARIPSVTGSAIDDLFDEFHLFLASQDPKMPKKELIGPAPTPTG